MASKSQKWKKISRWFRFCLEYGLLLLVLPLFRGLPRNQSLKLGGWLGRQGYWLLPSRRRLADQNMQLALPELSEDERQEKIRQMFAHAGISGAEMLRLDMFRPQSDDLEKYFDLVGMEHLQEAYALGRGVILLTGHVGCWEVGNYPFAEQNFPIDLVAKPMKNPLTDKYLNRMRESYGARVLDSKNGARRIVKSLKAGRAPVILLDQHLSPPGAVQVDFFGRKAFTTTVITSMAMKYQVPVVPVFVHRLPGFRYKVAADPMIILEDGDSSDLVLKNTKLLTDRIETAIREDVAQWFWMHKRWRER